MNPSDLIDRRIITPVSFPGVMAPVYDRKITVVRDRKIYLHTSSLVKSGTFEDMVFSENNNDICILPAVEPAIDGVEFVGWTSSDIQNTATSAYMQQAGLLPGLRVPYVMAEAHLRPAFRYEALKRNVKYPVEIADIRSAGHADVNTWGNSSWFPEDGSTTASIDLGVADTLGVVANTDILSYLVSKGFGVTVGFTVEASVGTTNVTVAGQATSCKVDTKMLVGDTCVVDKSFTKKFTFHSFLVHNMKAAGVFGNDNQWWWPERYTVDYAVTDVNSFGLSLRVELAESSSVFAEKYASVASPARARLYISSITITEPEQGDADQSAVD